MPQVVDECPPEVRALLLSATFQELSQAPQLAEVKCVAALSCAADILQYAHELAQLFGFLVSAYRRALPLVGTGHAACDGLPA